MKLKAASITTALIFTIALGAGPRPRNDELLAVVLARVPEKARAKRNPMEHNSEALAAGRKLFERHCAQCHGGSAEGSKRGPSLRDGARQATPGELFWILKNGSKGTAMAPFIPLVLTEEEAWKVISYVRSFGRP